MGALPQHRRQRSLGRQAKDRRYGTRKCTSCMHLGARYMGFVQVQIMPMQLRIQAVIAVNCSNESWSLSSVRARPRTVVNVQASLCACNQRDQLLKVPEDVCARNSINKVGCNRNGGVLFYFDGPCFLSLLIFSQVMLQFWKLRALTCNAEDLFSIKYLADWK